MREPLKVFIPYFLALVFLAIGMAFYVSRFPECYMTEKYDYIV